MKLKTGVVTVAVLMLVANYGLAQSKADTEATEVLAEVNGIKILASEIEEPLKDTLYDLERKKYEARMKEIEQRIARLLIEGEARRRGLTMEQLFQQEVEGKIQAVSEQAARKFFDENKARIRGTFEENKKRIMEFLGRQEAQRQAQKFLTGLRAKANIKISLKEPEEPKYNVSTDDDPWRGKPQALVTIIEFTDFQCPACKQVQPVVKEVLKAYGDNVKFVVRDFPLPDHQLARKAAEASGCAAEQNKYWEFHDLLFENQPRLEIAQLKGYAQKLGLNIEAFFDCLDGGKFAQEVEKDFRDGLKATVQGTPTFFINGKKLRGQHTLAEFKRMVDQEFKQTSP